MKNHEEIQEKAKPLGRISGGETLRMCVELSDAIHRIRDPKNNPTNAFEKTLKKLLEILGKSKTPYMLTGAVASSYYGLPRTTHDIDVVLDPQRVDASKLIDLARRAGFKAHKGEITGLLRVGNRFPMYSNGFRIDFWLVGPNTTA